MKYKKVTKKRNQKKSHNKKYNKTNKKKYGGGNFTKYTVDCSLNNTPLNTNKSIREKKVICSIIKKENIKTSPSPLPTTGIPLLLPQLTPSVHPQLNEPPTTGTPKVSTPPQLV